MRPARAKLWKRGVQVEGRLVGILVLGCLTRQAPKLLLPTALSGACFSTLSPSSSALAQAGINPSTFSPRMLLFSVNGQPIKRGTEPNRAQCEVSASPQGCSMLPRQWRVDALNTSPMCPQPRDLSNTSLLILIPQDQYVRKIPFDMDATRWRHWLATLSPSSLRRSFLRPWECP